MFTSITPRHPVQLSGRFGRSALSTQIAAELEANVILLPTPRGYCCLVGLDTLFASAAFKAAVLEVLQDHARARIDDLIFVASHTHNAPALDPTKPALGCVNEQYFRFASRAVADLIQNALACDAGPVQRVFRGSTTCMLNAVRRRRGQVIDWQYPFLRTETLNAPLQGLQVPRALEIAVACDRNGAPLWAIWSWCCHPTSHPEPLAISADFPGHVREVIRSRLGAPGLPIVFLPGFCGDVRPDPSILPVPISLMIKRPFLRPFAKATTANYQKLCQALGSATRRMLDHLRPVRTSPIAISTRVGIGLDEFIVGCPSLASHSPTDISVIALGDFGLLLIGAEVCSPYLAILAPLLPQEWMLSGYADDVFGYLPTDSQIAEGGYESAGFFSSFGLAGQFASNIEGKVRDACQSAIHRCSGTSQFQYTASAQA